MEHIAGSPKRKRGGQYTENFKRSRICESSFDIPLPEPANALNVQVNCLGHLAIASDLDDMKRYVTRSVAAKIQRVAKDQPDSEFIKGDITTTGLGVHLRWEYPDALSSAGANNAASPSTGLSMHSVSPYPPTASTPLSATSSTSSITSTRTLLSSDEEHVADSRPQTPIQDELYDPGVVAFPPAAYSGQIQHDLQPPLSDDSAIEVDHSRRLHSATLERQTEYRIHLEQVRKLEAWRKVKEEQWAEAEAAGVFDADESEDEDVDEEDSSDEPTKHNDSSEEGDIRMGESTASGGSQGSLGRSDTLRCLPLEPPSKLGPTLSQRRLPYMRTSSTLTRRQHSMKPTTTHLSAVAESTPSSSSLSLSSQSIPSSASTTSRPSQSSRCVRRYQENGVWKTAGSFNDLPVFAHLAAYDSLQFFGDTQPQQSNVLSSEHSCSGFATGAEALAAWPASLSRETTIADLDTATTELTGLSRRLHRSM